jgi:hypothetical protein
MLLTKPQVYVELTSFVTNVLFLFGGGSDTGI